MNLPLVFTILRWIGRPSALPAKVRTTVAAKQNGKKTPSLRLRPIDRLASSNVLYGCTENLRKPRVMIVTIISDDLKATCPPIPTGKGPGFCCRYLREQRALRVACGVYVESNLQFEFPRNAFSSLATPMSYLPCNSCCHWTFRKILRLELSEILFEELQVEQKQGCGQQQTGYKMLNNRFQSFAGSALGSPISSYLKIKSPSRIVKPLQCKRRQGD